MIMQYATFSKNLNPRNIDKSVSDIRIRIRFPCESRFSFIYFLQKHLFNLLCHDSESVYDVFSVPVA